MPFKRIFLAFFVLISFTSLANTQAVSTLDRQRSKDMLKFVKDDIKKYYYDPSFHGMDLDQRFSAADKKIDQAQSLGQTFAIIAQALIDLNDSHTFFIPPARTNQTEYGWQMQMIGDECYVKSVKPGSDAEAKGLKAGDKVLSVEGYAPNRNIMWKIIYTFYTIRPQQGLTLEIETPESVKKKLSLLAKVTQGKRVLDLTSGDSNDYWNVIRDAEDEGRINASRVMEFGDSMFIWKMPGFNLEESQIDDIVGKASKFKTVIFDLRGNPGGYEKTLQRTVANFFDHDVKIGDLKGRKESKPLIAKSRGDKAFKGKLIVLIDSDSGSAAELFARLVQLEKRGTVIGDTSAGAVMRAQTQEHKMGTDTIIIYEANVTIADVIMTDGKSLEHGGVVPDEKMLPTGANMAAKRDPVMSRATELAGSRISPDKTGKFFPIEWRK